MGRTIGIILNLKDKFSSTLQNVNKNTKKFSAQLNQANKFTEKIEKGLFKTAKAATAFNGILTFLNGVFAGDWSKAWQGVKDIFSGIWQSIKSIFLGVIEVIKGRINGITSQINNVAQKMSSLPIIGGLAQKINIPQFATGTQYFNGGVALVGEHGAEIVNMPSGSKVVPADKTKQLLKSGNSVNVHITVQGNVIGNEQYANQLGNIIVQKVLAAQGNI